VYTHPPVLPHTHLFLLANNCLVNLF
jgi:hypothetical protein